MRKRHSYFLLITALSFLLSSCSLADNERKMVREGNKAYKDSIYDEAEILYRKALDYNPTSFAANYNIANATYKQENYKAAVPKYKRLLDSLETTEWKSATLHNLANSYLHTQEIDKAIEAYKESLRHNPNDKETKYNLVYAMNLKQQQQQQNQQQENQEQNQQNQQQQQNQPQGNDKKEDQKSEQNNQPKDGDKETKPQPKPQEGEDEEQNNEQQDNKDNKDNKGKDEQDKDQQGDKKDNGDKGDEQENQQPKDNPQPIEPKEGQADENGEKHAIPVEISKEDAENLLDAIAVEEKQAQEKVQKDKARKKGRVRNKKNW